MADTLHYDRLGVLRELRVVNSAPPGVPQSNRFNVTLTHDSVDVLGRILHQRVRCDSMTDDSSTVGAPCGTWNPFETSTRYNRLGELVSQVGTQFDGSAFAVDTFHYDPSGNQLITTHRSGNVFDHTRQLTYGSASNRLTSATDSFFSTGGKFVTTYTYDLAGSRVRDTMANKYVQAYQYDAAGRMKGQARVEPSSVTSPGGGSIFVNDTVRNPNTCLYDADGRLTTGCGVAQVSYAGQNVVREHEGDWWYVTGPGLDEPILAVQRAPGTGEWLPVVSDGRGELIAIADSGGQLNSSYTGPEYDAGLWNSSGLTSHSRSFNPRRWATPGGIDTISTFRSRQYDPATGKWLQEDPIGVAGGVNLYQYNGNDPNSFGDPFGLCDPPTDPKCQTHVIQPDKGEIKPVSPASDPMLAAITGAVDALGGLATEGAEEAVAFGSRTLGRIVSEGEDVTGRSASETNIAHSMPRSELETGLRGEQFSARMNANGSTTFTRQPADVTTYIDKSHGGPAAQVFVKGKSVLKIRLGTEP
jgi:RHS repeat-associated protein